MQSTEMPGTSRRRCDQQRRFTIHPSDPRARRRISRSDEGTRRLSRQQALTRVSIALSQAKENALAQGTKITQKSQLAYWEEFCSLFNIEGEEFGAFPLGARHPSLQQIQEEENVLSSFMAFVVACPRKGRNPNTANYGLQCISAVRSHYEHRNGRRPGLREGNKTGRQLATVIKGFQKTNPSPKEAKAPILQKHLLAIKACLNLESNAYHRALWALWLTQWQGVLRSSDLIKKKKGANLPWIPSQETHRERLTADLARDTQGKVIGTRLKLLLKPNKTDPAGENRTIKTLVIDNQENALSAGLALRRMLEADSVDNVRERPRRSSDTRKPKKG